MSQLLAAFRRYVSVSVLKTFAPTNGWLEALRCEAWFEMLKAAPGVRPSQLEQVANDAIARRLERVTRTRFFSKPANDVTVTTRPLCRRCSKPIMPGDQGEWLRHLHGAPCENEAIAQALRVNS